MAKTSARIDAITVKPTELVAALTHAAKAHKPVYLWSGPGIGKSQATKQVSGSPAFNYFEDIRL